MSQQALNGKAFEYSCAFQLHEDLSKDQNVELLSNSSFKIAKAAYEGMETDKQELLKKAAKAAVNS